MLLMCSMACAVPRMLIHRYAFSPPVEVCCAEPRATRTNSTAKPVWVALRPMGSLLGLGIVCKVTGVVHLQDRRW